jgi:hypothetical protein
MEGGGCELAILTRDVKVWLETVDQSDLNVVGACRDNFNKVFIVQVM